jgi:hypothetical protein
MAPSDCTAPGRPMAVVTAAQSSGRELACALAEAAKKPAAAIAQKKHLRINPRS